MSEKLKPCPFCGSDAIMWSWNGGVVVECSKYNQCCHRASVEGKTEAEAIEKWNHRVERTAKVVHSDVFGDWKNMCGNCFEAGKKMGLFHEQKYCYECGCKLDWSDDE